MNIVDIQNNIFLNISDYLHYIWMNCIYFEEDFINPLVSKKFNPFYKPHAHISKMAQTLWTDSNTYKLIL